VGTTRSAAEEATMSSTAALGTTRSTAERGRIYCSAVLETTCCSQWTASATTSTEEPGSDRARVDPADWISFIEKVL
jgi:hypothetical protein